ncbi:HDOD domain-containing protein, partial [Propionivibrio sp.]|uniref:HDOD domain-containing protein n=1 Tax=Propionivibrio sp. TaxID=2212460 RepID=UPI003BF35840
MNPKLEARFETLKSTGLLPSPKGPALAVVQLTRQEDVSSAQLARAIQADPALVAHLLKLANAYRMPGARPILAIKDTIAILGLTTVRGLALGFSLMSDKRARGCRAFDYPAFWSRNLARAVAMQSLAAFTRLMQNDEAFTLGLLSRVGELGLASLFPEDYARLLQSAALPGSDLLALEQQSFEFDHDDLTAALLADWGFPASLIEPVSHHEQPEPASLACGLRAERLLLMLMLASMIADVCLAAKEQRRAMMASLFLFGGRLSIAPGDLTTLCDGIVRDWSDWCRLLEVPSQAVPPFIELLNAPSAPSFEHFEGLPRAAADGAFRVLVVDDDRVIRAILKALLSKAGYQCLEAENGEQGLELARSEHPDLMIVDWLMPKMDGVELIRTLRETASGRAIYILLLTSLDQESRLVEAFAAGADDFLSKPISANVLLGRLIAGERVVTLHREMARDQSNLQRFASEFANVNQRLEVVRQRDEVNLKRMELALRGGDLGFWDWDVPSGEVVFNERWCSMLGYRLEEIKPQVDSWNLLTHPDDQAAVKAALQAHLKGETPAYECEHRLRHKDGHWVWILDRGLVVERDQAGAPLRVVGTHMDISERKVIETELLRSNSELEQFSYSISHDMRQPLRMISSYLKLLEMSLADQLDSEKREYFNFAIDGAKRLDQMLLGLLDYSRIGRKGEPPAWIESRSLLDEALLYLRPAIAEAQAEVHIEGLWPRLLVSPDEMLRLLQNLIGNALKFRVAGRQPQITVSSEVAGAYWRLCVADNGIGILPEQSGRLFQVFQRLQSRAVYEGTGIGLALCRKIAEHHGGKISVASAGEGLGSRFCVELP